MSAYYKDKYNYFLRVSRIPLRKRNKLEKNAILFVSSEFGDMNLKGLDINKNAFLDSIFTILHSHKYKRSEKSIKARDFTTIRQLLYYFTLEAKNAFFSSKEYWLWFTHFYEVGGQDFIEEQSRKKSAKFKRDLKKILNCLYQEAKQELEFY